MSISPKDILNNKKNINKRVNINDINLNNISINDLEYHGDNYHEFINLMSLLENVTTCQISDAFRSITNRSCSLYSIKSINNRKVWGTVFTVETSCDDWGTSTLAIDAAKKGDILLFKVDSENSAIWGEIASKCALKKGIKATVIYGSARDLDVLLYSDYPIFAGNYCPNAGSPLGLGTLGEPIEIDGVKIESGDFLFGDENGIAVIPKTMFKDTMDATVSVKIKENTILSKINDGMSLAEILNLKKK